MATAPITSVNRKVRTGNTVVVQVAGIQVGLAQSVSLSDDYGLDGASGIGDIHIIEHVPTQARHSVSLSQIVLLKEQLRTAGIASLNGDDALKGIVFDFIVQDAASGAVLRKYSSCSYASGRIDIQKHQILVADAQFMALNVTGTGM
jgi:hypothetical protein